MKMSIDTASNGMKMSNEPSGTDTQVTTVGMVANTTDSWTQISGTQVKVTYVRELSGHAASNPPGVYHVTTVTTKIGNHTGQASSGYVSPMQYVDEAATVTLDHTVDACLMGDSSCFESTSGTVFCAQAAANVFMWPFTAEVEVAITDVYWPGTPPCTLQANSACIYSVLWHCDGAHTPPDYQVGAI